MKKYLRKIVVMVTVLTCALLPVISNAKGTTNPLTVTVNGQVITQKINGDINNLTLDIAELIGKEQIAADKELMAIMSSSFISDTITWEVEWEQLVTYELNGSATYHKKMSFDFKYTYDDYGAPIFYNVWNVKSKVWSIEDVSVLIGLKRWTQTDSYVSFNSAKDKTYVSATGEYEFTIPVYEWIGLTSGIGPEETWTTSLRLVDYN